MSSAPATKFSALNDWFTPKRFSLLLLFLLLVSFPDVLLLGKSFFFRDYAFFSAPLAYYQKECFWNGELPFWNGYHNLGQPFLAQWNTMSLYPGSLIYLLLPLPWSLNFFCLVHLFLGGMGMYFFARYWLEQPFAAAFAGLAYVFNAFTLNCLMSPHNTAALGWLPWVIWLAVLASRKGGRLLPLAALAGAMQFLASGPEIILQTWFLVGCFVVLDGWQHGWYWRAPARIVLIVLLVTGLSAAQLLPFLDLLAHSQRSVDWAADDWAMPVWGWLNLLVPKFGSYPGPHGVYSQAGQAWINTYYPGCIVTLLAALAWWHRREKLVLGCWGLTVFSLLMAQGSEGLLYNGAKALVPQLGYLRYPVKFIVIAVSLLPLLAAAGLRAVIMSVSEKGNGPLIRKLSLLTLLLFFAACLAARLDLYLQNPYVDWGTTLKSGLTTALIFAVAACLLLRWHRTSSLHVSLGLFAGFLALVWADQFIFNLRPCPSVKPWVYQSDLVAQKLGVKTQGGPGSARFLPDAQIEYGINQISFKVPEEHVLFYRMALFDNLNLLDHLPTIHGFYSLDLKYFLDVYPWFYALSDEQLRPLAEFAGLAYTQKPGKAVEWTEKWNPSPLVTAGQRPVIIQEGDLPTLLRKHEFHPKEEIYLYPSEAHDLDDIVPGQATVDTIDWQRQSVRFRVKADKPSLVVIAQSYYHPWTALVDSEATPLRRANHAFSALKVPAGTHEVKLIYIDHKFHQGLLVSTLTLLVVAGLLAWPYRPFAKTVAT